MTEKSAVSPDGPFVEIGQSTVKVRLKDRGLEVPLERTAGGRLSPACREKLRERLSELLAPTASPRGALIALPAHGVALRRFQLPDASEEETLRTLSLQVEAAFPLPPDELAWAYHDFSRNSSGRPRRSARILAAILPSRNGVKDGESAVQDVTVVGLRRAIVEDYTALLEECGLRPSFRLSGIVIGRVCEPRKGRYAVLDIGRTHSELTSFDGERPTAVRVLPWGGADVTRAIAASLGVGEPRAEELKLEWSGRLAGHAEGAEGAEGAGGAGGADAPETAEERRLRAAIEDSLPRFLVRVDEALSSAPATNGVSRDGGDVVEAAAAPDEASGEVARLFLAGGGARLRGLAERLGQATRRPCVSLEVPDATGSSASTVGLRRELEAHGAAALALRPFRSAVETRERQPAKPALARWLVAALGLAVASLAVRYGVPLTLLPDLRVELAETQQSLAAQPSVDGELGFLKHVRGAAREVAYLDLLTAVARVAPSGTLLRSISLSRRGEASIDGRVATQQHANEFRRGLLVCGLFSRVVLQELVPDDDGVRFRLQASVVKGRDLGDFRAVTPRELPPAPPPAARKVKPPRRRATAPEKRVPDAAKKKPDEKKGKPEKKEGKTPPVVPTGATAPGAAAEAALESRLEAIIRHASGIQIEGVEIFIEDESSARSSGEEWTPK